MFFITLNQCSILTVHISEESNGELPQNASTPEIIAQLSAQEKAGITNVFKQFFKCVSDQVLFGSLSPICLVKRLKL